MFENAFLFHLPSRFFHRVLLASLVASLPVNLYRMSFPISMDSNGTKRARAHFCVWIRGFYVFSSGRSVRFVCVLSVHNSVIRFFSIEYAVSSFSFEKLLSVRGKARTVHKKAMFIWNYCAVLVVIFVFRVFAPVIVIITAIFIRGNAFQSLTFFCHLGFSFVFPIHFSSGCVMASNGWGLWNN